MNIVKDLYVGNDISINNHLSVPDASFNNIGSIDGSLVVLSDLSVNGQIYISDAFENYLDNRYAKLIGDNTFTGTNTFKQNTETTKQNSQHEQKKHDRNITITPKSQ